jgi:hypothetical protein
MGLFIDLPALQVVIKSFYKLDTSIEFLACADRNISRWFYIRTGLEGSKAICLTITSAFKVKADDTTETDEDIIRSKSYMKDDISGIPFALYIKTHANHLVLVWWSKSGRIYEPTDTDIDCDDIEFQLEPFNPQLYYAQLNYKEPLPFKTDGFSFELEVADLPVHATFTMTVRPEYVSKVPAFIKKTYSFIDSYNDKSLANDRKNGVVHNSKISQIDNTVTIELDSGSAGVMFYKPLLKMISRVGYFSKVVIA